MEVASEDEEVASAEREEAVESARKAFDDHLGSIRCRPSGGGTKIAFIRACARGHYPVSQIREVLWAIDYRNMVSHEHIPVLPKEGRRCLEAMQFACMQQDAPEETYTGLDPGPEELKGLSQAIRLVQSENLSVQKRALKISVELLGRVLRNKTSTDSNDDAVVIV